MRPAQNTAAAARMRGSNRIKEAADLSKQEGYFGGLLERFQAFDIPGKFFIVWRPATWSCRDKPPHARFAGAKRAAQAAGTLHVRLGVSGLAPNASTNRHDWASGR